MAIALQVFLLPDRSHKSKRRTKTVGTTCEPRWGQTFLYSGLRRCDLNGRLLEVWRIYLDPLPQINLVITPRLPGNAVGLCALRGQRLHRRGSHRSGPSHSGRRGRVVPAAAPPGHLLSRMCGPGSFSSFRLVSILRSFVSVSWLSKIGVGKRLKTKETHKSFAVHGCYE